MGQVSSWLQQDFLSPQLPLTKGFSASLPEPSSSVLLPFWYVEGSGVCGALMSERWNEEKRLLCSTGGPQGFQDIHEVVEPSPGTVWAAQLPQESPLTQPLPGWTDKDKGRGEGLFSPFL